MTQRYMDVLDGRRTIAFLGEAGSGKTEIALNVALGLRKETDRTIHFFDMDQSKPLFRARDVMERMQQAGIEFHSNTDTSIEDVAAIAPGVLSALRETDSFVIMDVGGDARGARVVGQFFQELNRSESMVVLPVNSYRPWSGCLENLAVNIDRITAAARAECVRVFSNPNLCGDTTVEDVIAGHEKLKNMLQGQYDIPYVCALEPLCGELEKRLSEGIIPLTIQILYPWMEE